MVRFEQLKISEQKLNDKFIHSEMEGQFIHDQLNRPMEFIHSDNVDTVKEPNHTDNVMVKEHKHTDKVIVVKGHNRTCEMEGQLDSSGRM